MDNILKLIKEEEVKWVRLENIFNVRTGYTPSKKNLDFWKNGVVNWFTIDDIRHKGRILDYANIKISESAVKKQPFSRDSIILSTIATIGEYALINCDFVVNQQFTVFTPNEKYLDKVDMKFMRYYFYKISEYCKKNKRVGNVPTIDTQKLIKFEIPIPSLETQRKIVDILDKFTEYKDTLNEELELRKKQYNYYRDMLLSQDYLLKKAKELCGKDASVQWQTLENVFNIVIGGDLPNNVSKEKTEENKIPILSNGKNEKAIYGYTNIAKYETESITISARGTIGWTNYISFPFYPIVRLIVLMPKIEINCKYAYYYLKSIEDKYNISKGGIPQLTKPMIINNKIPIPPLEVQEWIVNTLYPFYTISYDLNKGLSKEIKLRAKQYEYYREQLLDFNK